MENPFFYFFKNIDRKTPKKIYNSNYIRLYEKIAFKIDFGPREVPQPEIHESESAGFLDGAKIDL